MIVGYNTDIKYRKEVFHIQTEDKGKSNPTIETLVYLHGEILLSRRLTYAHLLSAAEKYKTIKSMMKTQHDQVCSELKGGNFSHLLSMDTQNIEEKTLDEMVLQYMQNQNP
jgi:DNA-binding protein Fis